MKKLLFLHLQKPGRAADQCFSIHYKDSSHICGCTSWFVSDLVGNHEERFSRDEAHFYCFMTLRKDLL